MFTKATIFALLSVFLVIFIGCGDSSTGRDDDSDDPNTGGSPDSAFFVDYVHVDTSGYVVIQTSPLNSTSTQEPYLTWEEVIGEPFIDVNENGEYDPGIDEFIMCVCEDNMDLNHNGHYDGPDDPWDPSIPWDDIDGNGTLRQDESWEKNYNLGAPYFDLNGNGIWDGSTSFRWVMADCNIFESSESSLKWLYSVVDSAFYYDSDSGFHYAPPTSNGFCQVCSTSAEIWGSFEITAEGLFYYFRSDKRFHLADAGIIYEDTGRVSVTELFWDEYHTTCFREISVGQSLTVDGVIIDDLLKIRCDQIESDLSMINSYHEGAYWEFYFSQQIGLFAVHLKPYRDDPERWYYFEPREGSLPIQFAK
ncbi:MAG: hypothetical protein JSV52_14695 [Candidatus Zixiibacteriota bacterium]|nr:MAG: hypothetical protein JSV52_14695 [candidate division Zixibacteria bacterium]